tara:strand:+ start:420 stop:893 length:474 start_codon:yes stop_codon:yes gene_type:complete
MTTNTTKLAEAIGIISNVMTSEINQMNHSVGNEETVPADDYDDLKDLAENFNSEVANVLGVIQGELDACLEWEAGDPEPNEKIWDIAVEELPTDDTEESDTTEESEDTEPPTEDPTERIAELELTVKRLVGVLESVSETVNDLYSTNETFEEDLGEY